MCADFVEGCYFVDTSFVRGCGVGIDAYGSDGLIVLCPHTTDILAPETKISSRPHRTSCEHVRLKSYCPVKYETSARKKTCVRSASDTFYL